MGNHMNTFDGAIAMQDGNYGATDIQRKAIVDLFLYPEHYLTPKLLGYLDIFDLIKLAATNKKICENIFEISASIKSLCECIDFNKFPYVLTTAEFEMVQNMFPNAKKIIIGNNSSGDNYYLLDYLSKFYGLKELDIFIEHYDSFWRSSTIYAEKLTISSIFDYSYSDPAFDILYCCPAVKYLSISGGHLSAYSMLCLSKKKLETLSLKDVSILVDDIPTFIETILSAADLKKLKFVLTDENLPLFPTVQAMLSILAKLHDRNSRIEELTFTINSSSQQFFDFSHLTKLTNLKKLTVYFTVQHNFATLDHFLEMVPHLGDIPIVMKEFLQFPRKNSYTVEDVNMFRELSNEYRVTTMQLKNVTFKQYQHYSEY